MDIFTLYWKLWPTYTAYYKADALLCQQRSYSQSYGFFPVVMYECESWTIKKPESWRIDVFKLWCREKTLESPFDCKEIKLVNPKGNQPWIFIERTDTEAEAPILWPLDAKSQLIGKDPDVGQDWGQEKGAIEDEMVGWHHWLNGHEFEQTQRYREGQGSLACCNSWGGKESDTT